MAAGIEEYQPDIVINVGQAGGHSCVTIERVAINLAEARIPDNNGEQPSGEPLQAEGEPAYFATIPVKAIVKISGIIRYRAMYPTQQEHMYVMPSCIRCFI